MRRRRIRSTIGSALIGGLVAGCAFLAPLPKPTTVEQRLAAFPAAGLPLRGRVTVHWDRHQIPFIEAEHDEDAAFALGLVHAHLRLGQMETFRRIAQGRIAEMGGPLATDIDHSLRIIDFGRAAAAIEAALPPETRTWLTPLRRRHQPLPGERGRAALRVRRPRPRPRAVDRGRHPHLRPPRRHRRQLAGVVRPAAAARPPGLARAVGAAGRERVGLADQLRARRRRRSPRGAARRRQPLGQQQPRGRAAPERHRRRDHGQRPPSRHLPAQHLAGGRHQLSLLPRGRPDGAGAPVLRHRPQPVDRLGRHQHAGGVERALRDRRPRGHRPARAHQGALVVRPRGRDPRHRLGAGGVRRAAARGLRRAPLRAALDRPHGERRDHGHAQGRAGARLRRVPGRLRDLRRARPEHAVRRQRGEHRPGDGGRPARPRCRRPEGHDPPRRRQRGDVAELARRDGASLQPQPRERHPGVGQQPPRRRRSAGGLLLLARRPRRADDRAAARRRDRARRRQGAAAGRVHALLGGVARRLRRRPRRPAPAARRHGRGGAGGGPDARLGRPLPPRVPGRGGLSRRFATPSRAPSMPVRSARRTGPRSPTSPGSRP